MSLSKLLSVGHSFVGMNEDHSRFKMTQENLLPRFAPLRRSPGDPVDPAPKIDPPAFSIPRSVNGEKPVASPSVSSRHSFPGNGAAASMMGAALTRSASASGQESKSAGLFGFRSRAVPRTALIQPELSLDGVRVVRNDLSTADLELVRKPAVPPPPSPEPRQPAADLARPSARKPSRIELTGLAWNRLTARLFDFNRQRS